METHFLRVQDVGDPAAAAAVEAALLRCDPAAKIEADWQKGFVTVVSAVSSAAFCVALQDAGFIAAAAWQRPRPVAGRAVLRLVMRTLLFAVAAFFAGGILGLIIGVANVLLNPECSAGGDEGACAMGIPIFVVGFAVIGAVIGAAVTLIRGVLRLRRAA